VKNADSAKNADVGSDRYGSENMQNADIAKNADDGSNRYGSENMQKCGRWIE
jgi:hypothetical protein